MRLGRIPVSFFGAISQGQMSLAEWMDFAVELGLDGIECGPLLVEPLGPATPTEFRRLAEARGLAVSNYTGYSDFAHPDPEARQRELVAVLKNLEIAREVGAPSVRALTGQQWPGVKQEEGIQWVVEGIRRVAEEAERMALRLNVENHTKAATWTHFDFANSERSLNKHHTLIGMASELGRQAMASVRPSRMPQNSSNIYSDPAILAQR